MSVPYIRATFPTPAEVIMLESFKELQEEESDLAYIIRLYPKEFSVNAIISPEDNLTSTIQPRKPTKMASIWTIKPCFVVALAR